MKKIKIGDNQEKIVPVTKNKVLLQELQDLTPTCSLKFAVTFLAILSLLFLAFGIPIVSLTNDIIEYEYDYTELSQCEKIEQNISVPGLITYSVKDEAIFNCKINISIKEDIEGPVYLYYALTRFYSNHRSFFTSKSWAQLRNANNWENKMSKCSGMDTVGRIFDFNTNKYYSYGGNKLNEKDIAIPCGLLPKHYFQDTFRLLDQDNKAVEIMQDGLANKYDKEYAYLKTKDAEKNAWLDVTNDHFIVWMQTETWSNFRKIWGKIENGLKAGTYQMYIYSEFDAKAFNTEKHFILGTSSNLGWSSFLGWLLIGSCAFCVLTIIILLVMYCMIGDKFNVKYEDLSW